MKFKIFDSHYVSNITCINTDGIINACRYETTNVLQCKMSTFDIKHTVQSKSRLIHPNPSMVTLKKMLCQPGWSWFGGKTL